MRGRGSECGVSEEVKEHCVSQTTAYMADHIINLSGKAKVWPVPTQNHIVGLSGMASPHPKSHY